DVKVRRSWPASISYAQQGGIVSVRRISPLVIFLLIFTAASTALAQFDTATVLGTIKDTTGAVLPGVTVTLKNIDTGITVSVPTDGEGNYQFTNVKIGNYRVTAEMQGFSTALAETVNVTVNARQRVDLTLQPGSVTENVIVTASGMLLETDSSVRG